MPEQKIFNLKSLKNTIINSFKKWFGGAEFNSDAVTILESDEWPKILEFKTNSGDAFKLFIELADDAGEYCNIAFKNAKTGKGFKQARVRVSDMMDTIADNLNKLGVNLKDIKLNTKLNIRLQKIQSASDIDVTLNSVDASYIGSATDAWEAITEIVQNPEVVAMIPEETTSFSLIDEDDEFDFNTTEECIETSEYDSLVNLMRRGYTTLMNVQWIHWNARGDTVDDVHSKSNEAVYMIFKQLDSLGELAVELSTYAPNPVNFMFEGCVYDDAANSCATAMESLHKVLQEWIDALNLYYCNFRHDVQSELDTFIRDASKLNNYFIKQYLR